MNRTEESLPESSEVLQWHPAFYAGLQIELQDEADKLIFDDEYQLSTKPMEIDVLIIKKNTKEKIHKNIGRIFRTYNIIEYKSPTDYLSLDNFYKVMAYVYFYKADTGKENEIPIDAITLTFVCKNYPQTLISHLQEEWGCSIETIESGIYYVTGGKLMIPVQILLNHKLPKEENLWLHSLTNSLDNVITIQNLLSDYENHQENTLYQSILEIIVKSNKEKFEEVNHMCTCNALLEIMKDDLDARERQGEEKGEIRINNLNQKLIALDRLGDLIKSASDPIFQKELFKEFNL